MYKVTSYTTLRSKDGWVAPPMHRVIRISEEGVGEARLQQVHRKERGNLNHDKHSYIDNNSGYRPESSIPVNASQYCVPGVICPRIV